MRKWIRNYLLPCRWAAPAAPLGGPDASAPSGLAPATTPVGPSHAAAAPLVPTTSASAGSQAAGDSNSDAPGQPADPAGDAQGGQVTSLASRKALDFLFSHFDLGPVR
jgi:hypothetical protein